MKRRAVSLFLIVAAAVFSARADTFSPDQLASRTHAWEEYITQYMDWYDLPGLVVGLVKNGETAYAKGFGNRCLNSAEKVTKNTIFSTASVTKLAVGIAVMQLVEENKIGLDETVCKYLPYFALNDGRCRKITVAQLLNHTSGLPDDDWQEFKSSWENPEYDDGALKRYVRGLKTIELQSPPGEKYSYSNIGYEILGCLIAEISGMPLEEYIKKSVLEPLGMRQSNMLMNAIDKDLLACPLVLNKELIFAPSSFFPYTRRHSASGTLLASVGDMCRFAAAILGKGEIDGCRILKESSLAKMLTPINDNPAGLSFHVEKVDSETSMVFQAGGDPGFRTEFILIPEKGLGIVIMTNQWEHEIQPLALTLLNTMMGETEKDWFTFYHGSIWQIIRENKDNDAPGKIREFVSRNGLEHFHPAILNQHGNLLWDLGRAEDAIALKKLNIELYPKNYQLYNSLAESYAGLEDAKNAIIYYNKSLEIHPENNVAEERLKELSQKE